MSLVAPEIERLRALRSIKSNLVRLKWLAAATRFELAFTRHDRALKAGFNPDQPRVPAGDPAGGQWTDGGGNERRVRLAGDVPTGDSPKPPNTRPKDSRTRTAALKLAARLLGPAATVAEIAKLGAWMQTYLPIIESYADPPRSLEELQRDVSTLAPGYDIHHIVEQTAAERDGFPREIIDGPDNLVRVPRLKHQEINAWYQTKNPDYDRQTPRDYLSGRSWDVRREVGLEALRIHRVLKQ
jgi:hypothetical protein